MAGWGEQSFGASPWGGGSAALLDVERAWAASAQHIRVVFSGPVKQLGDRSASDGLNRDNYSLSVVSTTTLGSSVPPRILGAERISDSEIQLYLAGELEGPGTRYEVDVSATVEDASGGLIGLRVASLVGVATQRTVGGGRQRSKAIASPSLIDLAYHHLPHSPAGSLVVTDEGDYDLSSGEETLRKLVFRRLTTIKGEFVHLPDYGIAFKDRAGIGSVSMAALANEVERQLQREPELIDVSVSVEHRVGQGILIFTINGRLRANGKRADYQVPVSIGGAT